MTNPQININARCSCGFDYRVAISGLDIAALEFDCPSCGKADRFTPEQVDQIIQHYGLESSVVPASDVTN